MRGRMTRLCRDANGGGTVGRVSGFHCGVHCGAFLVAFKVLALAALSGSFLRRTFVDTAKSKDQTQCFMRQTRGAKRDELCT